MTFFVILTLSIKKKKKRRGENGKKNGLSDTCLFKVVDKELLYFQEAALVISCQVDLALVEW